MIEFGDLKDSNPATFQGCTLCIWHNAKYNYYKISVHDSRFDLESVGYTLMNSWKFEGRYEAHFLQNKVSEVYHNFKPYKLRKGKEYCFRVKDIQAVYNFIEEYIDAELYYFHIRQDADGKYVSGIGKVDNAIYLKEVPFSASVDLLKIEITADYKEAIIACQKRIRHYA